MHRSKNNGEDDLNGVPRPGEILAAKYRIDRVVGVGGMAVVLEATHLALREKVAIKVLRPAWSEDTELVARFMREGRAAARIRGEHVVRVLDVDQVGGSPYLVLEYLQGADLEELLAVEGPQPIARAVDFVLQACEALAEAHVAGLIHRDLKPANLFLCRRADGSSCVKVLNFGISKIVAIESRESGLHARATAPTAVTGSPLYMSPEQARSARTDVRTDIWSLGAILYELVAGAPPFVADTVTALCARIALDPPPPLARARSDAPATFEAAILRCLEKDPRQRFSNVAELAGALAGFGSSGARAFSARIARIVAGGIEVPPVQPRPVFRAAPPSTTERALSAAEILDGLPPTPMNNHVVLYIALTLVLSGLAGGIGWKLALQAEDTREADRKGAPAMVEPARAAPLPPAPVATSIPSTTGAPRPRASPPREHVPRAPPPSNDDPN